MRTEAVDTAGVWRYRVAALLVASFLSVAAVSLHVYGERRSESAQRKVRADLRILSWIVAADEYRKGRLPPSGALSSLQIDYTGWWPLDDPWHYPYRLDPERRRLFSLGSDNRPGGTESGADMFQAVPKLKAR